MRCESRIIFLFIVALLLSGCMPMQRKTHVTNKEDAARIHTKLGQGYMREGDYKSALAKLQKALQFDPNYVPAHTVIATLYDRVGEADKAQVHYLQATKLDPKDGSVNNNYAVFLCSHGKADEAQPYFDKALKDPFYHTPIKAMTNRGICFIQAGDYSQARKQLKKTLAKAPDAPNALYQMAKATYLDGDAFHASAYIQRYLALGAPSAKALKLGINIASKLKNKDAINNYKQQLSSQHSDSNQSRDVKSTASQ